MKKLISRITGIHSNRLGSFVVGYAYLCCVAGFALFFEWPLYVTTLLFMFLPGLYVAYQLHREGRLIVEALVFSIPAILTVDLLGHMSGSWDYWRSEIFGFYIGPYPLIGFFWGFSFWLAVTVFYEYLYDGSKAHKAPRSEQIYAFCMSIICLSFLFFYDGKPFPYFYAVFIAMGIALSVFLIKKYRYSFWKTYLPVLGMLPASLLYEYISLRLGHWGFDPLTNIAYVPFFGYSIPVEEILWFLVIQHTCILFHETFADNRRF